MYDILFDLLKLFLSCVIIGGIVGAVSRLGKNYFGKKTKR